MSTRAAIIIKDSRNFHNVYHHCDGYPEGVGKELEEVFIDCDANTTANDALVNILDFSSEYERTSCIHSDEEYIYVVDMDSRTISCYSVEGKYFMNASMKVVEECKPLYVKTMDLKNLLVDRLVEKLHKEIVAFSYRKSNGEIRNAIGTLDASKNEDLANYVSSGNVKEKTGVTSYWDVNKNGWRSFKNENLIEIFGEKIES